MHQNYAKLSAHTLTLLLVGATLAAFATGCSTSRGSFEKATGTGVELSKGNYTIVKPNARGESCGFRLLGILPLFSPTYAKAKDRLYDSVGESMKGRSIALANQSEDRSNLYLILFSIPKLTLTADVIEFQSSTE